ncbi:cache domain-containing sensor histidine kinase [Paenibacillus swuensis]|uniref:cache domain-containing sensor histidine kinase n=1 Tax=Paenibacillus swuensis TaxID=1178515 RepID=UPI00083944A0|nr:sensor histidine kinase [Paenibacillus swuensis]
MNAWLAKLRSIPHSSIRTRLLLYFILIALVPTTIIAAAAYSKSTSVITSKVDASITQNLRLINDAVIQKLESVNDISTFIYLNPDFIEILSTDRPDKYARFDDANLTQERIEFTNEIAALDKMLTTFTTENMSKTVLYPKLFMYNRPEYIQSRFTDKISDLGEIQDQKWYRALPRHFKYTVVGPNRIMTQTGMKDTIRIAKRLYGLKHYQIPYAGLLTIDIPVEDFVSILEDFEPTPNSLIYIVDQQHKVNVAADPMQFGKISPYADTVPLISLGISSQIRNLNGASMLVSQKRIDETGWTIVSLSPMKELREELHSFTKILYGVILLCALLALAGALYLSNHISMPIIKLVKSMSNVGEGNFNISLNYKRKDEFSYLISSYKTMLAEVKQLIDKLYISEVNKKEAELKALQAQINPHFLYNTLDSVNWLAIEHKVPEISKIVTSLSDFFRYSLNKGHPIISLEEEIRQVESYLQIQKIRFEDKFDYSIHVPQELLSCLTVKLTLQPLVENSILHGIQQTYEKGWITIEAVLKESDIHIIISDNGAGADTSELNLLLSEAAEGTGHSKSYGLLNVNARLKQTFGAGYGVYFSDNEPAGVIAVIIIPAVYTMEGYPHA